MLDNFPKEMNLKKIAYLINKETMVFNNLVQRPEVWDKVKKSELIESLFIGFPIPNTFARFKDGCYDILDGKQRLTTIGSFYNNGFALTELAPFVIDNTEYDVSGLKFSELPDDLKIHLLSQKIIVVCFDKLTDSECSELFRRLNNGKPLTTKAKMISCCKDIKTVMEIGKHPIFEKILTPKGRINKSEVPIIIKTHMMFTTPIEKTSYSAGTILPYAREACFGDDLVRSINNLYDYMGSVYDLLDEKFSKKVFKETHFVSLLYFANNSLLNKRTPKEFADFIKSFYTDKKECSVDEDYNEACKGGSASKTSVCGRHYALFNAYQEFFKSN